MSKSISSFACKSIFSGDDNDDGDDDDNDDDYDDDNNDDDDDDDDKNPTSRSNISIAFARHYRFLTKLLVRVVKLMWELHVHDRL